MRPCLWGMGTVEADWVVMLQRMGDLEGLMPWETQWQLQAKGKVAVAVAGSKLFGDTERAVETQGEEQMVWTILDEDWRAVRGDVLVRGLEEEVIS